MAVKSFSNKSNAKRALNKAGLPEAALILIEGQWSFDTEWKDAATIYSEALAEANAMDAEPEMTEDEAASEAEAVKAEETAPPPVPYSYDEVSSGSGLKIEKNREERNGVKRPSVGGKCRAVWDALDAMVAEGNPPASKTVKEMAVVRGWNPNNTVIEFYQWRKFNGITGRSK